MVGYGFGRIRIMVDCRGTQFGVTQVYVVHINHASVLLHSVRGLAADWLLTDDPYSPLTKCTIWASMAMQNG